MGLVRSLDAGQDYLSRNTVVNPVEQRSPVDRLGACNVIVFHQSFGEDRVRQAVVAVEQVGLVELLALRADAIPRPDARALGGTVPSARFRSPATATTASRLGGDQGSPASFAAARHRHRVRSQQEGKEIPSLLVVYCDWLALPLERPCQREHQRPLHVFFLFSMPYALQSLQPR